MSISSSPAHGPNPVPAFPGSVPLAISASSDLAYCGDSEAQTVYCGSHASDSESLLGLGVSRIEGDRTRSCRLNRGCVWKSVFWYDALPTATLSSWPAVRCASGRAIVDL